MKFKNEYFPQFVLHPGTDIEEKLEEIGMGPKEFSVRTGKPEKTITAVLKGDSSVTPDMAVQFEKVLKVPAGFWLRRQYQYDEYMARLKQESLIKDSENRKKKLEMIRQKNYMDELMFPISDGTGDTKSN